MALATFSGTRTYVLEAIQNPAPPGIADPDTASTSVTDTSWLHTAPMAPMRLAYICSKYLSLYSEQQAYSEAVDRGSLLDQWPLLEYSVKFWHSHYSQAFHEGAPDAELRNLIIQRPEVTQSWIVLQDCFGLRIQGFKGSQNAAPSATTLST